MNGMPAAAALLAGFLLTSVAGAQTPAARPWMNPKLTPDRRAALLQSARTLDEEMAILRGHFGFPAKSGRDRGALGSAGFVPGTERLGIPALQESDSLGVANPFT